MVPRPSNHCNGIPYTWQDRPNIKSGPRALWKLPTSLTKKSILTSHHVVNFKHTSSSNSVLMYQIANSWPKHQLKIPSAFFQLPVNSRHEKCPLKLITNRKELMFLTFGSARWRSTDDYLIQHWVQQVQNRVTFPAANIFKRPDGTIDPSHKSHNAPGPYPTVHHFVTEKMMHCGIFAHCIVGFVRWAYCHLIFKVQVPRDLAGFRWPFCMTSPVPGSVTETSKASEIRNKTRLNCRSALCLLMA